MGRVDDDPHRGEGEAVGGGEPRHQTFDVSDRGCTVVRGELSFYSRLGDRRVKRR